MSAENTIGFFRHKKLDHFFHGNPLCWWHASDFPNNPSNEQTSACCRRRIAILRLERHKINVCNYFDDWKACCQIQNWTPSISQESLVTSNIWRQCLPNGLSATASSVSPASSSREWKQNDGDHERERENERETGRRGEKNQWNIFVLHAHLAFVRTLRWRTTSHTWNHVSRFESSQYRLYCVAPGLPTTPGDKGPVPHY